MIVGTETITIINTVLGEKDEFGQRPPAREIRTTIENVLIHPNPGDTVLDDINLLAGETIAYTAYLTPGLGADITATSKIEYGGETFSIRETTRRYSPPRGFRVKVKDLVYLIRVNRGTK